VSSVDEAYDALEAACQAVFDESYDALSDAELVRVMARRERIMRQLAADEHRLIARLTTTHPSALGARSHNDVLATLLRVSKRDAGRRLATAADLGPRHTLGGEILEPNWVHTAAAHARGDIGADHIKVIGEFFEHLPRWIDPQTVAQAEANLADVARRHTPEELREAADMLLALLDPDGEMPTDDEDRARKRGIYLGKQQADGMSEIRGWLDPQARATLEAVFASWAVPGKCNPADEHPDTDTPDEAPADEGAAVETPDVGTAAERDTRTLAQRRHDALTAMGRAMLASGQLGQHHGLPATIVVTTTLDALEKGAGVATTAGGTRLPMSDVIRLASHAYHYLTVFDRHSEVPLYLGRTRRTASPGQWVVLYARDRGCTRPGCTAWGYDCQAHHARQDWARGGQTDITDLTLACHGDHRRITEQGWQTRVRADGRTEWIPPPILDTGQGRVNNYHHPERYLVDSDEDRKGGGTQDDSGRNGAA
jgi:hypothetical protein